MQIVLTFFSYLAARPGSSLDLHLLSEVPGNFWSRNN
jgi:hypothetical protein